jgi:hypothetical protein
MASSKQKRVARARNAAAERKLLEAVLDAILATEEELFDETLENLTSPAFDHGAALRF